MITPPEGWRLVIGDSGSTGATTSILADFADLFPLVVLSCLNPSIVTDNDILPDPDWLLRWRETADSHSKADFFGGTVVPGWPRQARAWLSEQADEFSVFYAQQRRGSGPCGFTDVFGPNMAIRSSTFAAGTRFAEHVGPDGTNPLSTMGSGTECFGGWKLSGTEVGSRRRRACITS